MLCCAGDGNPREQECWIDLPQFSTATYTVRGFYTACIADALYTLDDTEVFWGLCGHFDRFNYINIGKPSRDLVGDILGGKAFNLAAHPPLNYNSAYALEKILDLWNDPKTKHPPMDPPSSMPPVFSYHKDTLADLLDDNNYFNRLPFRSNFLLKRNNEGLALSGIFNFILNPHNDPTHLAEIDHHYIRVVPDTGSAISISSPMHSSRNTTELTVSHVRLLMWRYVRNILHYLTPRHVDWILVNNPAFGLSKNAQTILAEVNPEALHFLSTRTHPPEDLRNKLSFKPMHPRTTHDGVRLPTGDIEFKNPALPHLSPTSPVSPGVAPLSFDSPPLSPIGFPKTTPTKMEWGPTTVTGNHESMDNEIKDPTTDEELPPAPLPVSTVYQPDMGEIFDSEYTNDAPEQVAQQQTEQEMRRHQLGQFNSFRNPTLGPLGGGLVTRRLAKKADGSTTFFTGE